MANVATSLVPATSPAKSKNIDNGRSSGRRVQNAPFLMNLSTMLDPLKALLQNETV